MHVCEQLAQGCYLKTRGREWNPRPRVASPSALTTTPPGHMTANESALKWIL